MSKKDILIDTLYKVYSVNGEIGSLNGNLNESSSTIRANFMIDDEGPKAPSIDIMAAETINSISSLQNYVIPNLIYRINTIDEEEDE